MLSSGREISVRKRRVNSKIYAFAIQRNENWTIKFVRYANRFSVRFEYFGIPEYAPVHSLTLMLPFSHSLCVLYVVCASSLCFAARPHIMQQARKRHHITSILLAMNGIGIGILKWKAMPRLMGETANPITVNAGVLMLGARIWSSKLCTWNAVIISLDMQLPDTNALLTRTTTNAMMSLPCPQHSRMHP